MISNHVGCSVSKFEEEILCGDNKTTRKEEKLRISCKYQNIIVILLQEI